MRKIALVALCACFVGLTHLCSGADFQVLDERYTQAENQYKIALSKIESVLEKTKATKQKADEVRDRAVAVATRIIAKNKAGGSDKKENVELVKEKEKAYMAVAFRVMDTSKEAKHIASKASKKLGKVKSIKGKVDEKRNKIMQSMKDSSDDFATDASLDKFEAKVEKYEEILKEALQKVEDFEKVAQSYQVAVKEYEEVVIEYEKAAQN